LGIITEPKKEEEAKKAGRPSELPMIYEEQSSATEDLPSQRKQLGLE